MIWKHNNNIVPEATVTVTDNTIQSSENGFNNSHISKTDMCSYM
jgi:hypothetical protein